MELLQSIVSDLPPPWEDREIFADNFSIVANTTTPFHDDNIITSSSNSIINNTTRSMEEEVFDLFYESFNDSISGMAANVSNGTGNGTLGEPICVMCRYYLQPWLKALRVGFGGCIVLANIVTFVMLLRARTLQMALRYFLLNVAVVDCGYGAGFLYHSAIVDFPQFIVMNFECKLRYGGLCMVSMVALFTLMAMCVERVIALKFAFRYHLLITKTNLLIGMVIFWAVPAAIVTPTYILMDSSVGECNFVRFIKAESFVVFSVTYFMLMVVAILCQLVLLYIARTHIKKILPTIVGDQKKKAAFKMNLKATSTTLSLAVPFVICATPKILTYMFLAFNPGERIKVESLTLLAVTIYLNVSNSLINPIVYCYRLPELRTQIMAAFGRRLTSSTWSSDEPMKPQNSSSLSSKPSDSKDDDGKEGKPESKLVKRETRLVLSQTEDDPKWRRQRNGTPSLENDDIPPKTARKNTLEEDTEFEKEGIDGYDSSKPNHTGASTQEQGRKSSIDKALVNDTFCVKKNGELQCFRNDGTGGEDTTQSLQRQGGKKGERVRTVTEEKNVGKYNWLVDPGSLEHKISRRRLSDCSGQPHLKCHLVDKDAKVHFEPLSNLEKLGKKYQSTPNIDEPRESSDPSSSFSLSGEQLGLGSKPTSLKVAETKRSKTHEDLTIIDKTGKEHDSPEPEDRASPEGSINTEKKSDKLSVENTEIQDLKQEVGVSSLYQSTRKIFTFKHIWKLWAEAVLTQASKRLIDENIGYYTITRPAGNVEKIYPLRFVSGKAVIFQPGADDSKNPKEKFIEKADVDENWSVGLGGLNPMEKKYVDDILQSSNGINQGCITPCLTRGRKSFSYIEEGIMEEDEEKEEDEVGPEEREQKIRDERKQRMATDHTLGQEKYLDEEK